MTQDNVANDSLIHLSTEELIDLYHKRKANADIVLGLILQRAHICENTQQENNKFARLLNASNRWIGKPVIADDLDGASETQVLQHRITEALREYERMHG
jgi:hypothetical protein